MSETNSIFKGLSLSLCTYTAKISIKDYNYIKLGEILEPNEKIVAINSNFIHKAYIMGLKILYTVLNKKYHLIRRN